jgi:hypothetical protein
MITHHTDGSTQTWTLRGRRNAFITYSPAAAGSVKDLYTRARVGDGTWWCEDHRGYVYSFETLLSGRSNAPSYMVRLARRARRDTTTHGLPSV